VLGQRSRSLRDPHPAPPPGEGPSSTRSELSGRARSTLTPASSPLQGEGRFRITADSLQGEGRSFRGWAPGPLLIGWGLFLVALGLLAGHWDYKVVEVGGWHALLHYPRLYGALLLWGLMIALAWIAPSRTPGVEAT
jgi:hypothetical protein